MSAEQLAGAVSALGLRYTRTQVTNLESGRRESITVGEILAFAAVLGVPPLLLVFPVGRVDAVEPLPGIEVSPWEAVCWAEHGRLADVVEPATEDALVIHEYRRHEEFERMWEQSRQEVRRLRELQEKPADWLVENGYHLADLRAELADRERLEERAVAMLRQIRGTLERAGVNLPPVPPVLARVLEGELAL